MCPETNITQPGPEILIVEDSPTQAMKIKLHLEQHGFSSLIAGNGREAIDWLARNGPPQLIISDIVMPEMDGYELCRAIRADDKLKDIPFVLLSCLSEGDDILKGLESGASNFIVKPYDTDYLVSYIRGAISRKRQEAEEGRATFVIEYGGREFRISSNIQQIVDILLATYGTAVRKNKEIIKAENELRLLNEYLEEKVKERTAELTAEIAERSRVEEELRKKSEVLIEYSAKLEQSNRDLQDFAFIASHDLQEPVRKIQTFADRLNTLYHDLLDEKGRDYLLRVSRSARRMQELIMALLKYSRLTSNPENRFPNVNLKPLVEEALADLNSFHDDAGARIEIGALPTVQADPVEMRQLFHNLLGNALKYRGETSPVIRIYSTPCECEGYHEIHVEDNGIGFDECYLDNIFKPFQRLHGRSAPYEGTGMGLAICRKIVERHGGSITARSSSQKGAVFMVRLPERQS